MMKNTLTTKLSSIAVILLGFLIACTPVTHPVFTPTTEATVSVTVEPDPTSTVTATPSPNILELGSASELPSPAYKRECVDILSFNPKTLQDFSAGGTAVFSEFGDDTDHIVLYNLKNGEKHAISQVLLPGLRKGTAKVSPDRKWLFYLTDRTGDQLGDVEFVLADSQGVSVKTIPVSIVKQNGYSYNFAHEWLGNNSMRLWSQYSTVLLLDPFTQQFTKLKGDFDGWQPPVVKPGSGIGPADEYLEWGIDPLESILFQVPGANVAYSPDREIAFYPHTDGYDVLYDLNSNNEIARLAIRNWGELPRWSPAGKHISIIASPPNAPQDGVKKDFYLLSRDGTTLKRLTYLSEQFDRVSIKQYAWSPDDTKIAFWLSTEFPLSEGEQVLYELAIVDVTNGNISNYCVSNQRDEAKELAQDIGWLDDPFWSPDGKQLLIPTRTIHKVGDQTYDVKTLLFDPSKLSAMPIMDNILIAGWMTDNEE